MKRSIFYLLMATTIVLGTSSCKKRKLNRSTVTSQDNAIAEMAFNDVQSVTENGMKENSLEKSSMSISSMYSNCATFTLSPAWPDSTFPKTLTIDFGTTNCTDNYGVNRRGKIIATATGKYRDAGTIITITPSNYYVNDYKIEGTKTVTNNGQNSYGQTTFNINIDNAKVTYPNGDVITYEIGATYTNLNPLFNIPVVEFGGGTFNRQYNLFEKFPLLSFLLERFPLLKSILFE